MAPTELDPEQLDGLLDMDPEAFRVAAHRVVDLMADYIRDVEQHVVLPRVEPGSIAARLPDAPPERPESLDSILADYLEQARLWDVIPAAGSCPLLAEREEARR